MLKFFPNKFPIKSFFSPTHGYTNWDFLNNEYQVQVSQQQWDQYKVAKWINIAYCVKRASVNATWVRNNFLKWAIAGLFFICFRLSRHTLHFLQQIIVNNIYPVYGAGIQTNDFQNVSFLT